MSLQAIHEPLGKLVVTFGQLEFMVMVGISGLLRQEIDVCFALISEMNFSKRLDALASIAPYRIKDPVLLSELKPVIDLLNQAAEQRNSVIHSAWMGSSSGQEIFRIKPSAKRRHGFKSDFRRVTVAEINAVVDIVGAANKRFTEFMGKLARSSGNPLLLSMFSSTKSRA
jgi:hypothetical protein